ncbi:protein NLP5-like [Selaginella moellendorffii]|uniref:protein NLP5-like n=1 Tax=Selaginella moellendorffii TaxID=88036 RepID=UPI000D1C6191|nr:protein NLP5-like [Selaginella moellendorffii]XP_024525316.1 protein NLP5-like [Selaginella moellendorffii]|eukprot:XP_024525311.1 protein NLP5-like [Selaginella moellendorffii]
MPTDYISNRYMSKLGVPPQAWEESLDFDEVAKYFSMTVAEAANILGVCQATLKRICRENGLSRWPHRKFMGGKSVEEIKQDALRAKQFQAQEKMYNPQPSNYGQVPSQAYVMQTTHANLRLSTTATYRTKMPIPSFLDDFRNGYPLKNLDAVSDRWWGGSPDVDDTSSDQAQARSADFAESVVDATQLVNLRRKRAESLERALASPISRGYDGSKVESSQEEVLKFVFGEEMPQQWTYAFD